MRIFNSCMVLVVGIAVAIVAVAACQPDGRIDTLGERTDSLDQRLTAIEASIDAIVEPIDPSDQRLTTAEAGIEALGERIDSLHQRLIAVEARLAALSSGDTRELTTNDDSTGRDNLKVMEVTVGPKLLDCVGVGPRKCLEVNGQFFYEGIDGFMHEEGYSYRLEIEQYDAFPGEEEPPQDASRYGYRLIKVISKTAR